MNRPRRTWCGKFADSFRGLALAVRSHSSYWAHLPVAGLAVAAGVWFGLEPAEWALVALAIGGVLAGETFNTAIEELARAVGTYPDDGIRRALDVASAGVLVTVATAVAVGLAVFGPRLVALVW